MKISNELDHNSDGIYMSKSATSSYVCYIKVHTYFLLITRLLINRAERTWWLFCNKGTYYVGYIRTQHTSHSGHHGA